MPHSSPNLPASDDQAEPPQPSLTVTQDRLTRILAVILSAVVSFLILVIWLPPRPSTSDVMVRLTGILPAGVGLYYVLTRRIRRRRAIRRSPFPDHWRKILEQEVSYYQALSPLEQQRFREEVHIFIQEKRITGINATVDDTVKILVAASAIIPIFGFPGWEWEQIREVLIYPNVFDEHYQTGEQAEDSLLGMVGSGAMNRMMILSKPELLQGFRRNNRRHNVGIHEFTHLLDKSDGVVDGVPEVTLPAKAIRPWLKIVHQEMENIRRGHSDIDPYGITNEAEFFAVASEYFFENPARMKHRHPDLYVMLKRIFRQDPQSRLTRAISDMIKP